MRYGTRMHEWIARLGKFQWKEDDVLTICKGIREHELYALRELFQNERYQDALQYPEVYHELPFMVKDGQEILHGFIDFVAMDATQIILFDFKTDAISSLEELLPLYQDQLFAYEKAMHLLYPEKQIFLYLYSLKLHQEIKVCKEGTHA